MSDVLEMEPSGEFEPENEKELLGRPGVTLWTRGFFHSPIPLIIVTKQLRIIWANEKVSALYGDYSGFKGISLQDFFYLSLTPQVYSGLTEAVKSIRNAYSWRGRVERKGRKKTMIISNLLVLPAFNSPGDIREPVAFACILDNVSKEYNQMLRMTFMSLLEASRLKDNDTGNHIERVNYYSKLLARVLAKSKYNSEIDHDFIENIGFLAAMHDVGKIGTPDDILNKKGPLNDWEREIMEEHTINGAFILGTYPNPMAKEIALHHHEWWNGAGYPYGMDKELIPLAARIVALADVYDALRMKRSYKQEFSHEKALGIIKKGISSQFDPLVVKGFVSVHMKFNGIYEKFRD